MATVLSNHRLAPRRPRWRPPRDVLRALSPASACCAGVLCRSELVVTTVRESFGVPPRPTAGCTSSASPRPGARRDAAARPSCAPVAPYDVPFTRATRRLLLGTVPASSCNHRRNVAFLVPRGERHHVPATSPASSTGARARRRRSSATSVARGAAAAGAATLARRVRRECGRNDSSRAATQHRDSSSAQPPHERPHRIVSACACRSRPTLRVPPPLRAPPRRRPRRPAAF
jgi:hypothetical protein